MNGDEVGKPGKHNRVAMEIRRQRQRSGGGGEERWRMHAVGSGSHEQKGRDEGEELTRIAAYLGTTQEKVNSFFDLLIWTRN